MKLLFLLLMLSFLNVNANAKSIKKLNAPYMANTMQMTIKWNWNKRKLNIEAAAPANSIVGFEHIANTAKEKRKLRLQDAKLKKYPLIEQTGCKLNNAEVNTDLYFAHSHKKGFTVLPADKDDVFHFVGDEKGRVDYLMKFEYTCEGKQNLKLNVFKHFPKINKLLIRKKTLYGKIKKVLTAKNKIILAND